VAAGLVESAVLRDDGQHGGLHTSSAVKEAPGSTGFLDVASSFVSSGAPGARDVAAAGSLFGARRSAYSDMPLRGGGGPAMLAAAKI
jgi:hypothetical protein